MKCLQDIGAFGIYNSHSISGASQKHKHMQLIPKDVIWEARMHAGQRDAEFVSFGKGVYFACDTV